MNWNAKQRALTIVRMWDLIKVVTKPCWKNNVWPNKRRLQQKARNIREQYGVIIAECFAIPNSSLLRKAVISIRKGKLAFSWDQLHKACRVLFEETPYILFKSPKESRPYVTVLFWACDEVDIKCAVLSHLETVKKETTCLGLDFEIDVTSVFAPTRYLLYLLENSSDVSVENRQIKLEE